MDNICFVIMPFGIGFDDLYEKVYVPAIQSQGLSPLRADEIYDNQPIIRDITQSIHHAKVILADVTGRNPNVNYELGIAHALKKGGHPPHRRSQGCPFRLPSSEIPAI